MTPNSELGEQLFIDFERPKYFESDGKVYPFNKDDATFYKSAKWDAVSTDGISWTKISSQ
jgi:hypothetical protein